jgi:hypothetical protein|tara:strand:- start:1061 stop:1348 length:288 start_codon:yes stop_codon:yes gene_type:complete
MNHIFEVTNKSGRKIHLSKERWGEHIRPIHPEIKEPEEIEKVLKNPEVINQSDRDEDVRWYYKYNKQRKRYFKVSVKYLNGNGFVITAHYTRKIE